MEFIKKCDLVIYKLAASLLVASILAILFFSSGSIILRWFHFNFSWIDPFVRHLVLLSTFLGGVVATGKGNHIGIDLISKFLEIRGYHQAKILVNRFILLISTFALLWLFKAGIDFTLIEMEFSKVVFLKISSGHLVAIIPFGLALMTIRFFTLFILSFDKDAHQKKVGEV